MSRKHSLLANLKLRVVGMELLKECYKDDVNFEELFQKCNKPNGSYFLLDGFLFKGNQLCAPRHSVRESLILEYHEGGLTRHFEVEKTIELVGESFYWPKLAKDVAYFIKRCVKCQKAKHHSLNKGLYLPLQIPTAPWEDVV